MLLKPITISKAIYHSGLVYFCGDDVHHLDDPNPDAPVHDGPAGGGSCRRMGSRLCGDPKSNR